MKKISFVIPCYRSRDTIWHVVTEIDGKMEEMQEYTYEILMVNDCSPDDTMDVLKIFVMREVMGTVPERQSGLLVILGSMQRLWQEYGPAMVIMWYAWMMTDRHQRTR